MQSVLSISIIKIKEIWKEKCPFIILIDFNQFKVRNFWLQINCLP